MTTASDLFALQEVDLALDKDLARLAEIEANLVETEELLAAREKVAERKAPVGLRTSDRAEILGGVEPGETVVVSGAGFLTDGALVTIRELD
jgi:hypothetical protein